MYVYVYGYIPYLISYLVSLISHSGDREGSENKKNGSGCVARRTKKKEESNREIRIRKQETREKTKTKKTRKKEKVSRKKGRTEERKRWTV